MNPIFWFFWCLKETRKIETLVTLHDFGFVAFCPKIHIKFAKSLLINDFMIKTPSDVLPHCVPHWHHYHHLEGSA